MRTSGLATIKRIDELIVKNNERLALLEAGPHVPRPEAPPRNIPPAVLTPDQEKLRRAHRKKAATRRGGSGSTIFSGPCDPSCPACAQYRRVLGHGKQINKLQKAALIEMVQSRIKQDPQIPTAVRQDKKANRQKWLADQIEKSGLSKEDIEGSRMERSGLRDAYKFNFVKTNGTFLSDATFSNDLKALGYAPR